MITQFLDLCKQTRGARVLSPATLIDREVVSRFPCWSARCVRTPSARRGGGWGKGARSFEPANSAEKRGELAPRSSAGQFTAKPRDAIQHLPLVAGTSLGVSDGRVSRAPSWKSAGRRLLRLSLSCYCTGASRERAERRRPSKGRKSTAPRCGRRSQGDEAPSRRRPQRQERGVPLPTPACRLQQLFPGAVRAGGPSQQPPRSQLRIHG